MDRLKGIIKKEFYHIFRDKRTLLILFGIPIVQIVLFGFAISTEIKEVKVALLNQSKEVSSHQLVNKILSTSYFKVDEILENEEAINTSFKKGRIKAAIVIPPHFEEDILKNKEAKVQIICDASDPNTGTQIGAFLEGQIQSFLYENAQKTFGSSPPIQINTEIQMRYNPELKSAYTFVPGLITIILMLICTMMTSIAITREIETGTMEVLLASPMHPSIIILGKVIPYLALSFSIAVFILFLGKFVFGVPILAHFGLITFEILLYCLVVLALGIFISTVAKTQQLALMISLFALFLPTMLLSGFIFPIHNMPLPLQMVTKVIPATYFNIIIKALMLKGATISEILKETLVLAGMFVVLVGVSIKRFNIRLG
ncbi:ABC transporter permease [Flammeovirga pacifica]|uniref:Multidrug ABC transporter permease n=1 Tax=Flammeovirga pacifica TaxID=915059 RepID=A0A1S1YW15_FLAPC|nr:ABC transporter permease [Flammeovirga pacifica]OHX65196.1 multidrug ABC transporter permease [Flammeovirga pacifica]